MPRVDTNLPSTSTKTIGGSVDNRDNAYMNPDNLVQCQDCRTNRYRANWGGAHKHKALNHLSTAKKHKGRKVPRYAYNFLPSSWYFTHLTRPIDLNIDAIQIVIHGP